MRRKYINPILLIKKSISYGFMQGLYKIIKTGAASALEQNNKIKITLSDLTG